MSSPRDSATAHPAAGTLTLGGDLVVNRIGFGAMRITGPGVFGPPADRAEGIRVLRRAVELGVNFIDTADSYGPNVSEELIAEALHPYPAGLVVATKAGYAHEAWRRDPRSVLRPGDGAVSGVAHGAQRDRVRYLAGRLLYYAREDQFSCCELYSSAGHAA